MTPTWLRLWRDLTAAPEFYRERRGQPLELALAVAEPTLSVALAVTLVAGIATFATTVAPSLALSGLAPVAIATALLGFIYSRRLDWSGIIVREWVVLLAPLLALWRLITLFTLAAPPGSTVRGWLWSPIGFFDASFLVGGALLLLAWTQGWSYGRDLATLHPVPRPWRQPEPGDPTYWLADELRHDLFVPAPSVLVTRWLRGGVLLTLLSALGAAGVRQTINGPALLRLVTLGAPDESTMLPNVLAYMLCGLVLVGLAQLSRQRANWVADDVQVMPGLARRALIGLGVLVAGALAIGLALPTRYSVGVGDLLRLFAGLVAYLGWLIGAILAGIAGLLFALLSALFGLRGHVPHVAPPPHPPPPMAVHGHGAGGILGSLLFWAAATAVLCYCLYMLLRQAEGRVPALSRLRHGALRLFSWLARVAIVMLGAIRRGASGAARLARRLGEARQREGPRGPRVLPRPRGPREVVTYLYLSIEERARRLGLPRQSGQTALEYSRRLRAEMPDLDPDLSGLTDLFVEARYSPHPFTDERVPAARRLGQHVRARLRARGKAAPRSK